jgi:hypothetical protein
MLISARPVRLVTPEPSRHDVDRTVSQLLQQKRFAPRIVWSEDAVVVQFEVPVPILLPPVELPVLLDKRGVGALF